MSITVVAALVLTLGAPMIQESSQGSDAATAVATPPADEAAAPAQDEGTPPSPRMICRNETVVGTRFPTRVCMRAEEVEARRRDSRELARRLELQNANRGRVYAPSSPGGG